MKKKYFFVISFLILAMFLSGCAGGGIVTPATDEAKIKSVINEYLLALNDQNWNKAKGYCVYGSDREPSPIIFKANNQKYLINFNIIKAIMKKLFVLGMVLFFCLFFVGCRGITIPTVIPNNGGMDEYDSQFISLLDKLNTPLKLLNFLSTCHYKEHDGAYTPYEFYIGKEGDCVDFSIFSCYVLHYHDYNVYSVPIFFLNESAGHLLTVFEYKDTDADWYWGPTLDKYGVIDVSSLFSSVSPALDSIETCVNSYIEFLGDSYTLASYEVHPWNYCGYRTIAR